MDPIPDRGSKAQRRLREGCCRITRAMASCCCSPPEGSPATPLKRLRGIGNAVITCFTPSLGLMSELVKRENRDFKDKGQPRLRPVSCGPATDNLAVMRRRTVFRHDPQAKGSGPPGTAAAGIPTP